MIHTAKQLKDKVSNISHGDSEVAQMMIRNFIMERFLERLSLSMYNANFILKGGMLISSLVGISRRATMDIDTSVKAIPLNERDAAKIVDEIIKIPVEDGMYFEIVKVMRIMADFEYPGIRITLEARLDRLKQRIKIDLSTDDVITPAAIRYSYPLMFEDRKIELMCYTPETLLAEKIQTILARGVTTTRMRDYYDVYEIVHSNKVDIDKEVLAEAFFATCVKRKTVFSLSQIEKTIKSISEDDNLSKLWELYQKNNFYVGDMAWQPVCDRVCKYIAENLVEA